jgi:uncharacterized protein YidB (DUF937 family)
MNNGFDVVSTEPISGFDVVSTEPATQFGGIETPTKADMDTTRQSTIGGGPRDPNALTLGDFASEAANVVGSAVVGAPLELADQIGFVGNKLGITNPLEQKVAESRDILLNEGLSPAGLNAGAVGIQGAEMAATGSLAFAGIGLGTKAILGASRLAALSNAGRSGGIIAKIAGFPVRVLFTALEDATVAIPSQVAGQAKAFGAASAASSGIKDDNIRMGAEILGSISLLTAANSARLAFYGRTAGKHQLGTAIKEGGSVPFNPLDGDGEVLTLASATQNPTIKATEKAVRSRDAATDILFRNVEEQQKNIAKEYAKEIIGNPEINMAELEAIQASQLQSVETSIDAAIENNAILQASERPMEAGVATEALLGKTLDAAVSAAEILYSKVGDSSIKAMKLLPSIKKALNISDLEIKAKEIYPKIQTLLGGIRSTIKNIPEESSLNAQKKLLAELQLARKNNDFVKFKSIKKSLSRMKGGVKDKTPLGELTINQIQGARSLLLQGIREANASGQSDLARRYSDVLNAVEQVLTDAELAGNVDVVALRAANAHYRQLKGIFGLGEIAKSLQVTKAGGARLSSETLGPRFIKTNSQNGAETATQVVAAVERYKDTSGVSFVDLQNQMRTQFAAMIATRAGTGKGGRITASTLQTFIRNHSNALEVYGLKGAFDNVVASTKVVDDELAKMGLERAKILNRTFVARLLSTDNPASVVKSALDNNALPRLMQDIGDGENKEAIRGFITMVASGDVENAFVGNGLKKAISSEQVRDALGKKRTQSLTRLSNMVDRLSVSSDGATPIREARKVLPDVINRKIERLGRRFFAQIRTVQNKIGITALEAILENASRTSHEILVAALLDGKGADMLVRFAEKNPEAFRFMLKQAFIHAPVKEKIGGQYATNKR